MKAVTTLHIKKNLYLEISDAAVLLKISKNELVSLILSKALINNKRKPKMLTTIKYQENAMKTSWHNLHVAYKGQLYESCQDIRKIYKLSVSCFFSCAASKFLKEIIEEHINKDLTKNTDNYPPHYIFMSKFHEGLFYFTIFWGIPKEKKAKLILENML